MGDVVQSVQAALFNIHVCVLLQIKIPVAQVLNITREKTAIFIPNAIGVVTSEDKVSD